MMSINQEKCIYLGANIARHKGYNVVYQDLLKDKYNCDIGGDMCKISLKKYDCIICTPPCNYWSKARGNKLSKYAIETKHLLPTMLIKLARLGKPFIVENVTNKKRFIDEGIYNLCAKFDIFVQRVGRHTYFTNRIYDLSCEQVQDFKYGGVRINNDGYNQGGGNVHAVIDKWLEYICQ